MEANQNENRDSQAAAANQGGNQNRNSQKRNSQNRNSQNRNNQNPNQNNRNQNQNNRNQNQNQNQNQKQNQNQNQKQKQDANAKEQAEKEREMQLNEMKAKEKKEKKETRKEREHQLCLMSNKLSRDKKDYILCSTKQYELDKERYSKKEMSVCCASCPPRDANTEVRCPGQGKKVKPNKDNMRCFTVNMICQKLYMPGRDFECADKLKITADICKGCKPVLKADRINVNCLPQEPIKCFPMEAECLQRRLEEGIVLTVIYKNKEIGRGCYVLPESCILRLMNIFDEVTHTANVELTCHGCTVGMCTVHLGMQMRCQDIKLVTELTDKRSKMEHLKGGMDMCMDSMSSTSSTDPCAGFMNEPEFYSESDECNETYEGVGMDYNSTEDDNPGKLVDMAGPFSFYVQQNDDEEFMTVNADPQHSAQFSPNRQSIYGDGCINRLGQKVSEPQLKQTCVNSMRICHVCKEDVSWLPKIAACPHCNYKPVPQFQEKPYDVNATADGLLQTCLEQLNKDEVTSSEDSDRKSGDHDSSEDFDKIMRNYEQLKQTIRKIERPQTEDCMIRNTLGAENKALKKDTTNLDGDQDKQPKSGNKQHNLATVFQELKELFKLKNDDTNTKIQKICEEANKLSKCSKAKQKKGSKISDSNVDQKKKQRRPRKKMHFKSKIYEMPSRLFRCCKTDHKHNFDGPHVPAHMGWLWTSHPLAKKTGWRPGAINRSTRALMRYFLRDFPVDTIPVSKYMSFYNQKPPPPKVFKEKTEELVQKPTLYIEKKNDEYIITLHPLKDSESLARSADPYVNMKPVQFRIVKNPLLKEIRDLKRCLKAMGFAKCTCHKPVIACYCRSFIEKKKLVDCLQKECEERDMDSCENALVLSDTSDSEAEFEFGVTPPAGLIHPERQKAADTVNAWTQYDDNDWTSSSMFPHPPNRLVQYSGCVVGERKKPFTWIYGKGNVHETPKEPIMRNKPKKKKKAPSRQAGGFDGENLIRSHVPLVYGSDSDYPLSESRMRRLDQAAYPPTDPSRLQKQRHVRFASQNSVNST